jgi:hypothetical protein
MRPGCPFKDFIKHLQEKEIKHVMRVRKRFNPDIDRMRGGGGETRISEGIRTRAVALRVASGEREALTTSLGEYGEKEARTPGEREPRGWAPKDRLIGMLITDDSFARNYLYRELVPETRWRAAAARPNREASRKAYLRKPHFHHNHKSNC